MEVVLTGKLEALPPELVHDLTSAVKDFIRNRISLPFLIAARNLYEEHKSQHTLTTIEMWPQIVQRILESTIDDLVRRGHRLACAYRGSLSSIGMRIEELSDEELVCAERLQLPFTLEGFFTDQGAPSSMVFA